MAPESTPCTSAAPACTDPPATLPAAPSGADEIAMLRAAQCSGGAARLRPYMTGTHRADEARARHDELVAAEAEWKARAESERHPSRG